jgi:hypothetical protein
MARKRDLKPGFFTNERLAEIEPLGRLLFAGLWTIADREGRLEDRPRKIRAEILPYDDCDANALLDALATRGFILRYEVDGEKYIQIINFRKHQSPHPREIASAIPPPPDAGITKDMPRQVLGNDEQVPSNPGSSFNSFNSRSSSSANTSHSTTNTPGGDNAAADEQKNEAWDKVQARFAELTGRIFPSPLDAQDIKEALELAGGRADMIISVMNTVARRYKPKTEGDKINSFSYFLKPLRETVAYLKARASPGVTPAKRARSGTIMSEIMSGLPPDLRGETCGKPEDDLNRFIIRDTG